MRQVLTSAAPCSALCRKRMSRRMPPPPAAGTPWIKCEPGGHCVTTTLRVGVPRRSIRTPTAQSPHVACGVSPMSRKLSIA